MSQFGGSSRQDDYGYFGPEKPSTSTSQFGSAPTASTSSTFGSPAPASSGFGYGAPPAHSAPGKRRPPRSVLIVGGLVLTLALLAGGARAWEHAQRNKPIVIPTTLSGLSVVENQQLKEAVTGLESGAQASNPTVRLEAQGYGGAKGFETLVVLRGPVKTADEMAGFASSYDGTLGPQHSEGSSTCVTDAAHAMTFCLRTSRTLTVEVFSIKGAPGQAAAAVDEAWQLQ